MGATLNGRGLLSVEAHVADDTLLATETGTVHTNTGAAGAVTLTLPAATVGLRFMFAVGAAQALQIDPRRDGNHLAPLKRCAGRGGQAPDR